MNVGKLVKFFRYLSFKTGFLIPAKKVVTTKFNKEEGNNLIFNELKKEKPVMICRLGTSEANVLAAYTFLENYKSLSFLSRIKTMYYSGVFEWSEKTITGITRNAGFFPNTINEIEKFAQFFGECFSMADILGVWGIDFEADTIDFYNKDVKTIPLRSIEPYYFDDPWSKTLKGKKILIIHPFADTIKKQYEKRENIFKKEVLPEFELLTIKAVQSAAYEKCEFPTWFDAYEWMCSEIDKKEFDVAIIGAGAYGLPLAAYIKKMGKQAIHMGGSTQILFGIKGKRWENHEFISKLFNEHWVYPSKEEVPMKAEIVEGGCYW